MYDVVAAHICTQWTKQSIWIICGGMRTYRCDQPEVELKETACMEPNRLMGQLQAERLSNRMHWRPHITFRIACTAGVRGMVDAPGQIHGFRILCHHHHPPYQRLIRHQLKYAHTPGVRTSTVCTHSSHVQQTTANETTVGTNSAMQKYECSLNTR